MSDTRVGSGTKRDKIVLTHVGLFAAAIVAGMASGAAIFVVSVIFGDGRGPTLAKFPMFIMGGAIGGVFALVPAYLVGLPLHHYLVRKKWNSASTYAGMAAAIASTTAFVLPFVLPASPAISKAIVGAILLTVAPFGGAIGGVTFWFIRRPDRDAISALPTP